MGGDEGRREIRKVLQGLAVFIREIASLSVQQTQAPQQVSVGGAYGRFHGPWLRGRGGRASDRLECACGVGAGNDHGVDIEQSPCQARQPVQANVGPGMDSAQAIARRSGWVRIAGNGHFRT